MIDVYSPDSLVTRIPRFYPLSLIALAAGGAVGTAGQGTVKIDDTPFVCTHLRGVMRDLATGRAMTLEETGGFTGAAGVGPTIDLPFTINLQNTGTDRNIASAEFDAAVLMVPSCNGLLPIPLLLRSVTTATVTITMLKPVTNNLSIRIVLCGFQDYNLKNASL